MFRFIAFLIPIMFTNQLVADEIVWSGNVSADGTPTKSAKLNLGKKYKIRVEGSVNLGKWWQQGKPLASDACYEYAENIQTKIDNFKNSMNISVCDDTYHDNHIYESKPFIAAQNGIHFWIYDSDYSDNSGNLKVYLILVENRTEGSSVQ